MGSPDKFYFYIYNFCKFFQNFSKASNISFFIFHFDYSIHPVFERNEPFFVYIEDRELVAEIETTHQNDLDFSLGIIEPLTDRLNRTYPWKMFVSGYTPNISSLSLVMAQLHI